MGPAVLANGAFLQGRYRIEQIIGRGGMGSVYLATDLSLKGKRIAIKELVFRDFEDEPRLRAIEQFQREAAILATLDHPGLVSVSHYFEEGDKCYLVMAYVDGQSLDRLLEQANTFFPVPQCLDWAEQIVDVLDYLHNQEPPIIFRDLKPGNVMIDSRKKVRLVDFGIARSVSTDSRTDTFIKGAGSQGFAPPEQYGIQGTTDQRSDIYSLGATLYCLLARKLPPSSIDLLLNHATLSPVFELNYAVTNQLSDVVLKMMATNKEERFQTMAEVRDALVEARSSGRFSVRTAPPTTPILEPVPDEIVLPPTQNTPSPAGGRSKAAALVMAAAAVGIGLGAWHSWKPSEVPHVALSPSPPPSVVVTTASLRPPASPSVEEPTRSATPVVPPFVTAAPLQVDTAPAGATVFIDDVKVGKTPYHGREHIGPHWFRVTLAGYKNIQVKGWVRAGVPNHLRVELTPSGENTFTVQGQH
ncbi:MAG TPA: serine/threonine-protein kinase [Candidatus Xenobia bacterium]|jgi:serine/threonine-protein kinase